MKFTVDRDALARALGQVAAVVERRNTIPILSNLKLSAEGDALRVTGTDLDLQLTVQVPASIEASGETTLPAHTLHAAVREIASGAQIRFEMTEDRVALVSGRGRLRLLALPVADFPDIKPLEAGAEFSIEAKVLAKMLARVGFAQSADPVRYYLNGVLLHSIGDELRAVATNGNVLGVATTPLPDGAASMDDIVLPTKLVATLSRLLADREGDIGIRLTKACIKVTLGDDTLSSKAIDGSFPDYERVIPSANPHCMEVSPGALTGGLRRVISIADERIRVVKLSMATGKLTITGSSPEDGVAEEEVPVSWDGGPLVVGFNSRFLLDVIAAAGAEQLSVAIADATAPALFTNPTDTTARWVVMPMRV